MIAKPRKRFLRSRVTPHRISIRELRALAYDLHAWRLTALKLHAAGKFDGDAFIVQIDKLINWVSTEQTQVLIDRVACSNGDR